VIGEGGWMVKHDTPQRMAQEMAALVRELMSRSAQPMIEAGMKNAKRFSWDTSYQQTKQIYRQLSES